MVNPGTQSTQTRQSRTITTKPPTATRRIYRTVALDTLKKEFYVRTSLDQDHVLFLAQLLEAGTELDRIVITDDNEVIDGRHRIAAAELLDRISIEAEVRHYDTKLDEIAAAIQANYGGALPPTVSDLRHAVVTMIQEGAGLKRLRELLPLPTAMVRRLHADAHSAISKYKVSQALNAIAEGDITMAQAAEHFGVDPSLLKTAVQSRRKKEKGASLGQIKTQISQRTRSVSARNREIVRKLFDEYSDGTISDKYALQVLSAMTHSAKRITRYVEECRNRFTELQRKATKGIKDTVD